LLESAERDVAAFQKGFRRHPIKGRSAASQVRVNCWRFPLNYGGDVLTISGVITTHSLSNRRLVLEERFAAALDQNQLSANARGKCRECPLQVRAGTIVTSELMEINLY
jgi:hypothetical protein